MKILALETTEQTGSVAVACSETLLCEMQLPATQRTAQSLAPGMKNLLEHVGWKPADVELVAVSMGPGSFTGLRIGLTAAKVFAYSVGANILGIDTLETIAAAAPGDISSLSVAIDAQRGEVVEQRYQRPLHTSDMQPISNPRLISIETWLAELPEGFAIASPILKKLPATRLPQRCRVLPQEFCIPRASVVARLAWRDWQAGRRDDLWKIAPKYSRLSAAEEKFSQK